MRSDVLGDIMVTIFYVLPLKIVIMGTALFILALCLRRPAVLRMKHLYGVYKTMRSGAYGFPAHAAQPAENRFAGDQPASPRSSGAVFLDVAVVALFLLSALTSVPWLLFVFLIVNRMLLFGY